MRLVLESRVPYSLRVLCSDGSIVDLAYGAPCSVDLDQAGLVRLYDWSKRRIFVVVSREDGTAIETAQGFHDLAFPPEAKPEPAPEPELKSPPAPVAVEVSDDEVAAFAASHKADEIRDLLEAEGLSTAFSNKAVGARILLEYQANRVSP